MLGCPSIFGHTQFLILFYNQSLTYYHIVPQMSFIIIGRVRVNDYEHDYKLDSCLGFGQIFGIIIVG